MGVRARVLVRMAERLVRIGRGRVANWLGGSIGFANLGTYRRGVEGWALN